jgi:hypothetical protein
MFVKVGSTHDASLTAASIDVAVHVLACQGIRSLRTKMRLLSAEIGGVRISSLGPLIWLWLWEVGCGCGRAEADQFYL